MRKSVASVFGKGSYEGSVRVIDALDIPHAFEDPLQTESGCHNEILRIELLSVTREEEVE